MTYIIRQNKETNMILKRILRFADKNTNFDPSYFEDLAKKLERKGKISDAEYKLCVNVHKRLRMDYLSDS